MPVEANAAFTLILEPVKRCNLVAAIAIRTVPGPAS